MKKPRVDLFEGHGVFSIDIYGSSRSELISNNWGVLWAFNTWAGNTHQGTLSISILVEEMLRIVRDL